MHPYLKGALIGGGILFFIKMFEDSRRLVAAIKEKAAAALPTNNIAGLTLPNPLTVDGKTAAAPVNRESSLANSNPATDYGAEYFDS